MDRYRFGALAFAAVLAATLGGCGQYMFGDTHPDCTTADDPHDCIQRDIDHRPAAGVGTSGSGLSPSQASGSGSSNATSSGQQAQSSSSTPAPTSVPSPATGSAPPPAPVSAAPPPMVEVTPRIVGPYVQLSSGLSVSQDVGLRDDSRTDPNCVLQPATGTTCVGALDQAGSSGIIGGGIGWGFGFGLRAGFNYMSRSGYDLSGTDEGGTNFDPRITSHAYMVDVVYDLPLTFWSFRPFVGVGVGASRNKMEPLVWSDSGQTGVLPGGETTQFAYSLSAGASVPLFFDGLFLQGGYRFVDLGHIKKDAGADLGGPTFNTGVTGTMTGRLQAHEVMVNLIYSFGSFFR